ncbi:NucA/NucB deoxyribonuclease domain-containing protein [Parafrankia sp. CH37]|uniref:NucA/NucB deoxyribonuclease domain-containing protein n=1 Tax=Parafrankia sp. CH37 TaxID=683308 RepID=UPI0037CBA795
MPDRDGYVIPGAHYTVNDQSSRVAQCTPQKDGSSLCSGTLDVDKPGPEEAQKAADSLRRQTSRSSQDAGGATTFLVPEYNLSCVYLAFNDTGAAVQEWSGNRTSTCRLEHHVVEHYASDGVIHGSFSFDLYLSQDLDGSGNGVPWKTELIGRYRNYWPQGTIQSVYLGDLSLATLSYPCITGYGGQVPIALSPEVGQEEDAAFWGPACPLPNTGTTINVGRQAINYRTYAGPLSTGVQSVRVSDNQAIRCDRVRVDYPGCVVPKVTGIIQFDRAAKPLLQVPATNYLNWQIQFPNHVGYYNDYYGYGAPLTYTNSSATSDANYAAACGPSSGWVAPPAPNNSCDEYPFGSTLEGAAMAGGSYGVTWGRNGVTPQENSSGGGTLSVGYSKLHILNGDKFLAQVL